jgi:hypothetical protein
MVKRINMKSLVFFFLGFLLLGCATSASTQGGWAVLGSAKVNGQIDHDEIWVTGSQGDFKAVKLAVENEGIQFDRVVLHFANGGQEQLNIRRFIPAGGETKVLDLKGNDRVIKKVDFWYESNAATSTKAKVVLYGKR